MVYKSLLLDVDGTLVPVGPFTVPTPAVIEALKKAKTKVHVSTVSGRPLEWLSDIFTSLNLTDPCIINGGSQIVDPRTKEVLWERPIDQKDMRRIFSLIEKNGMPFLINDNGTEHKNPTERDFTKPLAVQLTFFDSKESSDACVRELNTIHGIAAHKFFSWQKDRSYKMEIYITHREGTKKHAVQKLAKMLNVKPREMIGVGDARNDIPLLNVCGLKVAMGNADDKLKNVAEYICPSVTDDGIADVVEKFILNTGPHPALIRKNSFFWFLKN